MRYLRVTLLGNVWSLACLVGGCGPSGEELYRKLQDKDPSVRIAAAVRAAELKDEKAVPHLVERLSDGEDDVRFFAYIALRKITGQTMGYRYYDPPQPRAEAIRRWREWMKQRHLSPPTTRPEGGGA